MKFIKYCEKIISEMTDVEWNEREKELKNRQTFFDKYEKERKEKLKDEKKIRDELHQRWLDKLNSKQEKNNNNTNQ